VQSSDGALRCGTGPVKRQCWYYSRAPARGVSRSDPEEANIAVSAVKEAAILLSVFRKRWVPANDVGGSLLLCKSVRLH
jgi:hypothetical protein